MKAKLLPVAFSDQPDAEFTRQVEAIRQLLQDEAEILTPIVLGMPTPQADAVVIPQMLGDAYRRVDQFRALNLPVFVVTSEFGTVSMWDWEINSYLRSEGIQVIAPYNLEQARQVCQMLAVKRALETSAYLVYQDNPGEGFQASIFKRFYWWEEECTRRIKEKFGVTIQKRSFRELGARAKAIADNEADACWQTWQSRIPISGLSEPAVRSAVKLYMAVKNDVLADPSIQAVGINCLNESHFSDTTPCMAWNMLFEERGILWGCEADTVAMLTKQLVYGALHVPVMMTNMYPFLMGQAALKHERIPDFPPVSSAPENHILAAHCGYLGVVPQSFATEWTLREKVLAIVNPNAHAIDARIPTGDITLVKVDSTLSALSVIEGEIVGYAGFPGSDCLNGAVIRVPDGPKMMASLASHHYILARGHHLAELQMLADIFGMQVQAITSR